MNESMNRNAERDADLNIGRYLRDTPVKRYILIRVKIKAVDAALIAILIDTSIGIHVSKYNV